MSTEKTSWGYQSDNDESLKSKVGGRFGLNTATISKFEYNPNGGKDESPADCIDLTVNIGDKEYRTRVYDITGDLFKGDAKIAPGEEGYDALWEAEKKQKSAVILHIVKAFGVTEDQIKKALSAGNVVDFASWAQVMCSLKGENFAAKEVDVFLEFQWAIKGEAERTFLQLPANMKGGRFLSPAIKPKGSWKPVFDEDGLVYKDDAGQTHPFDRSLNYMESNKAILQVEGEEDQPAMSMDNSSGGSSSGASSEEKPAKSKW